MEFSKQEYWSVLPCPLPGDFPDPGIDPVSCIAGRFFTCVAHLVKNMGDLGSVPGLGRSPGEGNGYPLQYSGLGNSMEGGARWATVYGVAKSWTRLSH